LSVAISGVTFWIWQIVAPDAARIQFSPGMIDWLGLSADDPYRGVVSMAAVTVVGLFFTLTLPFATRGLVLLHDIAARGMLGAFRSDALQRRVVDLSASRGAAISAEGHSLRRLERDIHDGPQQRLVRLQMDLAAADRQLDRDPGHARRLIAEAMQQAKDALEELRSLSRGFAPPMLLDRGLVAALESAATRSAIPTRVMSELPAQADLPQEIERNTYFVASEALANAAKHSGASAIEVRVAFRRVPETDATWLEVAVTDNGRGGALVIAGHGLAGLEERLRGLGGILRLDSPAGGPTAVTALIPVTL
jgi:signal transduction histidine kinase